MSSTEVASASALHGSAVEATKKLNDLKKTIRQDAQNMISKTIPKRIAELNELLQKDDLKLTFEQYVSPVNVPCPLGTNETNRSEESHYIEAGILNGTKVLVLPDGVISVNKTIERLQQMIKPLVVQLVDDCNLLKMWIQLLIPKVEDGNNFGVGIQEECLDQVGEIQKDSASYLDQVTRYYSARAKTASKVAKYPHVKDFRKSVEELDQKQYFTMTLAVKQLRNDYSLLHDIITKNMEKIQKPRNSNAESLY